MNMNKHIVRKYGYKNQEEKRKLHDTFRSCVILLNMENSIPLENEYSDEQMKEFITKNIDTVIDCSTRVQKTINSIEKKELGEGRKNLIKVKSKYTK